MNAIYGIRYAIQMNGSVEAGDAPFIARSSLHAEVVARLRDMIVERRLPPGSRIPERELCERFGISRTPLREALKVLTSEGLVELLHNRGARVTQLTERDIRETFEVLASLEALAGEQACELASDAQIEELAALHRQMAIHHARREREPYFRLNQQIHEHIMIATNNAVLRNTYNSINARVRPVRYFANLSSTRWDQAMAEHEEIMAALERRDGAKLANILRHHLRSKCEAVIGAFREPEAAV